MTDEEKERILQEQRSKEVSSIKPKNKAKIWKKIDELWERMDDWADSTEDDDGPINLWPFRQLYYLADSLEKFTHNLVARKKFMPLFAELLGQFLAMTFYMLILAVISIVIVGMYYLIKGSAGLDFLIIICSIIVSGPWLGILFHVILCPPLWFAMLDKITGNRETKKNVSLTVIRPFTTALNFYKYDNELAYSYDDLPYNFKFYFYELKEDHVPKSSKPHYASNFYEHNYLHPIGTETKYVRFVNTLTKSQLIDELFYLEPTMEFEVSYLRFSKFLKEIRPMEGYEYAEGVPEILKQINSMYP